MHTIFRFEVEYCQYSVSAKSCKRVQNPFRVKFRFGNIPIATASICLFETEYWNMYTAESGYEVEAKATRGYETRPHSL